MAWVEGSGEWWLLGAVVAELILGIALFFIRPRQRIVLLLAVYLLANATSNIGNISFNNVEERGSEAGAVLLLALLAVGLVGLTALTLIFVSLPTPPTRKHRGALWVAALLVLPLVVANAVANAANLAADPLPAGLPEIAGLARLGFVALANLVVQGAVAFSILRYPSLAPNEQRSLGILFAAMLLSLGLDDAAQILQDFSDPLRYVYSLGELYLSFLFVTLWIMATRGPGSRRARNLAILVPAMLLAGMILAVFAGSSDATTLAAYGIGKILSVLLLSYGVLRLGLAGVDLKARIAVKGSALAGIVLAVSFVAAELAQQLFGSTTNSAYIGIGAAGLLVFAIAPLQRFAERVATRAVPLDSGASTESRLETYRAAVRYTLADRRITEREERHLARLADDLGIKASDALEARLALRRDAGKGR